MSVLTQLNDNLLGWTPWGRKRARLKASLDTRQKQRFSDVCVKSAVLEEVKEVAKELEDYSRISYLSLKHRHGVVLVGPAGVGKTLIARAIAGEANARLQEFDGADLSRADSLALRAIFSRAHRDAKNSKRPQVLLFERLGVLCEKTRLDANPVFTNWEDARGTIYMQSSIITGSDGTMVIATANSESELDQEFRGLMKVINIGLPDAVTRQAIFELQLAKMIVVHELRSAWLAEQTDGFSGAQIKKVCEAATNNAVTKWKHPIRWTADIQPRSPFIDGPELEISKDDFEQAIAHLRDSTPALNGKGDTDKG